MNKREIEIKLAYDSYIREQGYKTNVVGHKYMYELIKLMLEDRKYLESKMLMKAYGEIGKKVGISASGVDRALRTLIKKSYRTVGDESHVIAMYIENEIYRPKNK